MPEATAIQEASQEAKAAFNAAAYRNRQIALGIIDALGGERRLRAMIGADKFMFDGPKLGFTFKGNPRMNYCKIELDEAADLYTLTLSKIGTKQGQFFQNVIYTQSGLYNDMLKEDFEATTQLRLSL